MKQIPGCSICQNKYNQDQHCPLLLQCGHTYCTNCIHTLFTNSTHTTLPCPKCRHVSFIANSVQSLNKNFAVLELIHSSSVSYSDNDDDDDHDNELSEGRQCRRSLGLIELGRHEDLRIGRRIGDTTSGVWNAVVSGSGGRKCRHNVAVKKVGIGGDMDLVWIESELENLRRASMWCRNVCVFHGVMKSEGCLNLVMDRCCGSILTEMERNGGRLTLEQILRFGLFDYMFFLIGIDLLFKLGFL